MKRKFTSCLLSVLYAIGGLFACISLAVWSATAYVAYRHISNFEGAAGYAAMFQMPFWYLLYAALLVGAFLWLRKHLWLLAVAVVVLGCLTMPAINAITELAWDVSVPTGPFGRL
ncbi:hypothetical protein RKE25_12840 [Dyella sp. BiH032]|uniref:hypothetical protein n=1 Tax=Dyella sp. BiH032 TaxID=3075430 RepID=UPI00289308A7|nr:hypothetical protein [Dyella sp. BiH032]WNL44315.1 hypothetical protein RKE25_12840 [Dyella sp. BiH032]